MLELNKIYLGDCLEIIKTFPDNSIDSIVTDPPYELGFMGKSWDNTGIANNVDLWRECLRVLKPGGHLLSFSGTRTYHRMASAIEDAGFEVRDMIEWCYGSGFPKSLNIVKAVDKLQGNEREVVGELKLTGTARNTKTIGAKTSSALTSDYEINNTKTDITKGTSEWEGRGTALKPAHEPICMARKPLSEKTIAENCLKWGTGGINIEISRVTSNSPVLQNNQDYENVCNEFSYIQQSFLSSLSDTFFLSHELSQGYLKHIFFVLSPYNNCDTITLHTEVILAHTFDKGLQDALYDYGLKVQNVNEYVQSAIKAPNFQDDYPTLFSFCDALFHKKTIPFKDIVALSNDVQIYISDFINSGENITLSCSNPLNTFFVVFPYIMMLINKAPTLYLFHQQKQENIGRFPSNLIHDNSEEVRECFPESKAGKYKGDGSKSGGIWSKSTGKPAGMEYGDNGNASRFFKSILYYPKASKSERNNGCEGLENRKISDMPDITMKIYANKAEREVSSKLFTEYLVKTDKEIADSYGFSPALIRMWRTGERIPNKETYYRLKSEFNIPNDLDYIYEIEQRERTSIIDSPTRKSANNHPTVKPIALMEYLIKMITKEGGIVLDPFAGSGTTLVAAKKNGYQYIGCELTEEYIPIIEARLNTIEEEVIDELPQDVSLF